MKRLFPFFLSALLLLAACAVTDDTGNTCTAAPDAAPEAAPETDQPPEVPDVIWEEETPDFRLDITAPEAGAERLLFAIINDSGADAQILLIPTLTRKAADSWETVPFLDTVGFCGTPSLLPAGQKDWAEDLAFLWGSLPSGEYRLSYTVTDSAGREHTALGTFTLPDGSST